MNSAGARLIAARPATRLAAVRRQAATRPAARSRRGRRRAAGTSTSACHGSRPPPRPRTCGRARSGAPRPPRTRSRPRSRAAIPAGTPSRTSRSGRRTSTPDAWTSSAAESPIRIGISPASMFSCACRFTIRSPASPPRSSSSFTAGNAWIGPWSVPTASAATPTTTNARSGCAAPRLERRSSQSRNQNAANISIPAIMISGPCSGVAASACSGVRPCQTTRWPSCSPR